MNARLREAAATLCSAIASDRVGHPCKWIGWNDIAHALGTTYAARQLASEAWATTSCIARHEAWALACSLLRSGEFEDES